MYLKSIINGVRIKKIEHTLGLLRNTNILYLVCFILEAIDVKLEMSTLFLDPRVQNNIE